MLARHRGPDGDGAWALGWAERSSLAAIADGTAPRGGSVALGFVRLSILDLGPTGAQPMVAPGRVALVLNGEIYNYVELREELRALGRTFTSTGDCEVLLNGWLEWREELFARMNGMWAIALHDIERDTLMLSRDRFGEKPLFWTRWRGGIAFASEVKQLRSFPDVSLKPNIARAAGYLRTGRPYLGASSWFDDIHQVEPASHLIIDRDGPRTVRYWSLSDAVAGVIPSREAEAWQHRFADAFTKSVGLRLRSDVPVGTSLSGGVDSSAVMAEATALGHRGYQSFTLVSADPRLNEGPAARTFARSMGSTWHPVQVSGADFATLWDRMTWHQESPVPTTSLYGQWKVMEAARAAGVIVLLDGQGGDEILGGYHKFLVGILLARFRKLDPSAIRFAWAFARHLGSPRAVLNAGDRYLGRLSRSPDPTAWLRATPDTLETVPPVRGDLFAMQMLDIESWSLPNLLSFADRNSMAFGVEVRLPYLDPDVTALSLAMPPEVLTRRGWSKWPLRQTLAAKHGSGPAWRRGKRWFGVPQRDWLRGPLALHVDEWRCNPHRVWSEVVDPAAMRRHADIWRGAARSNAIWDARIFEQVALDRFFRTWF